MIKLLCTIYINYDSSEFDEKIVDSFCFNFQSLDSSYQCLFTHRKFIVLSRSIFVVFVFPFYASNSIFSWILNLFILHFLSTVTLRSELQQCWNFNLFLVHVKSSVFLLFRSPFTFTRTSLRLERALWILDDKKFPDSSAWEWRMELQLRFERKLGEILLIKMQQ